MSTSRSSRTWRVVKLGLHKSPEAYVTAIETKGEKIRECARDILANVACSQEIVDIELVDVSGAELGFARAYTTRELYQRTATGSYPCPAETGPATRDQYDDQPPGEYTRIVIEPTTGSDSDSLFFYLGYDWRGRWLEAHRPSSDETWSPGHRWILCRCKP